MRSCFFQLRCHQSHSTFPLSQTEFAFYFYPFTLIPVILCLITDSILLWSAQSRTGQPDSPLFAVADIFSVPVNLICQYPAGVVSLALAEIFNHFLKLCCLIVGIEGMILQTCPAVRDTDVKFHAKLYGLPAFPRTIGRTKGWLTLTIRFSTLWVWLSYMNFCCS